jgi:hypothetical protein
VAAHRVHPPDRQTRRTHLKTLDLITSQTLIRCLHVHRRVSELPIGAGCAVAGEFPRGTQSHKCIIANLSPMPPELIDGLRARLAGGVVAGGADQALVAS